MSPHFVFHRRMDSHDGKECEECKEVREVVEMKLEVERGTSTDLSAQKKYKYDEPEAGGALNFLLGREINEAAADHDGEEYKEREEGREEVDVVKTADLSAQKKYKYDEPEAGGARNFLLGGAINEAAADHDGEEYKEGEEEVEHTTIK